MDLFISTAHTLVLSMLISCYCYIVTFFVPIYFLRRRVPYKARGQYPFLFILLWFLLMPPFLYRLQLFLQTDLLYLLFLLALMMSLVLLALLCEETLIYDKESKVKGGPRLFLIGMHQGVIILCAFILMPNVLYNLLIIATPLSTNSPVMGFLCFGSSITWFILSFIFAIRFKSFNQRPRGLTTWQSLNTD